jgi:hypothetical protein
MIGGAEVFHQKTAEWLVKQGHEVDVVTCIWDKPDVPWRNWQKNKEVINEVTVYRVRPWFYIQYLKSFGAILPLYKKSLQLIKEKNYDMIHAHIFPALIVGALLKRKTGLPLVTTIQGGDLADYSETGSTVSWLLKPIISYSLKKANVVHTVSTHMENSVKRFGVKNTKVIPNGVDTLLFKPRNKNKLRAKYEIPNNKYVIISHSRLTPKNGLDILIKAVSRLPDKDQVLVLLVGGGEQEEELRNLVKKLRLGRFVKFLGYKERKITAELLSLADMFVRPSCQEGFGIAFLEAMASGLPVIGTKVGGITDIVKDRSNGMLVGSEDVTGLLETIKIVLNDAVLRTKMGDKGLSDVSDKYNWEELSKKLLDVYKGINNL